jgi:hypothetical protein
VAQKRGLAGFRFSFQLYLRRAHRVLSDWWFSGCSEIESGHVQLAVQPADVATIVRDLMASFEVYARAKNMAISYTCMPAEMPILVLDVIRLRQVCTGSGFAHMAEELLW